jgi:integrase
MGRSPGRAGRRPNGAGAPRQLASGRWQARYRDDQGRLISAPRTFDTKLDATSWLQAHASGELPAEPERFTVAQYGEEFLRTRPLKPRTRLEYQRVFDTKIVPTLGEVGLHRLTPASVRAWYATLDPAHPTRRAHAYSLLRTICNAAIADDLIGTNPCRIRGAGNTRAVREVTIATLPELEAIVTAMPERLRPMVLLAAWCGLRFGELAGLTRADLDLEAATVTVRRAVVRLPGEFIAGDPKSAAGKRTVAIPPHLLDELDWHLDHHVLAPEDSPVFSRYDAGYGGYIPLYSLHKAFWPAREAAGRPDLHFHDLRHTGATLAAATGATLADLMARIGHSTPAMALRYQHAVHGRDQQIAAALSGFAQGKVIALNARSVTG